MKKLEIKSPFELLSENDPKEWDINDPIDGAISEDIEPQEQTIAEMKDFCDWLVDKQKVCEQDTDNDYNEGWKDCLEWAVYELKERGLWVE